MIKLAGFLPSLNKNGTKQATNMPDKTENNNIKPRFFGIVKMVKRLKTKISLNGEIKLD